MSRKSSKKSESGSRSREHSTESDVKLATATPSVNPKVIEDIQGQIKDIKIQIKRLKEGKVGESLKSSVMIRESVASAERLEQKGSELVIEDKTP